MANKITFDGDFKPLMTGFSKIGKEIKKLGDQKIGINIDDKELKNFRKFSAETFKELQKEVTIYTGALRHLAKIEKEGKQTGIKLTKRQRTEQKLFNDQLKTTNKQLKTQVEHFKAGNMFQRTGARLSAGGGVGGRAMGGIMSGLGKAAPFIGGGLAAFGAARAISAPRRALAEQNLQFMGLNRGAISGGQLQGLRRSGLSQGFNAQQQMESANLLQRNVGDVGGNPQALSSFARLRRTTGMGAEDLAGMAGGFRAAATTPGGAGLQQNIDKTQKMFRQAMISALDSSGTIKFMQKIAEMTESMAETGTADVNAIADTLTNLSLSREFFMANVSRGTTALAGGEGFFKSAGGTGLAMRAMRAQGVGGDMSAPELLLQQQRGFTREGGLEGGLEAITREVAFATTGIRNREEFEQASPKRRAAAALSVQQSFGLDDPRTAEELLKASFGIIDLTKEQKEEINKASETEKQKLASIDDSLDLGMRQNAANFHELIQTVGEKVAGPLTRMEGWVIGAAKKFLGIETRKTTSELSIEKDILEAKAKEEGGGFFDRAASLFGKDIGTQIVEKQKEMIGAKVTEGRGLTSFGESNQFVEGALGFEDTAQNISKVGRSGVGKFRTLDRDTVRNKLEDIKSARTSLAKNIVGQRASLEGGGASPEAIKKELREEQVALARLDEISKMLHKVLGDMPTKSINNFSK